MMDRDTRHTGGNATQAVSTGPLVSGWQYALLVMVGIVLWALGVVFLRHAYPAGWLEGQAQLITYALTIPATVPFVPVGRIVARLPRDMTLRSVAVVCITALLIDGVVVGRLPWIYAVDDLGARLCGAALLWGVGVALLLGVIMQPTPTPR